jgi:hypothetical protein
MSMAMMPAVSAEAATVGTAPGRALGLASNVLGPRAAQVADINGDGKADVFAYRAFDLAWLVSYSGTSAWTTVAHGAIDPNRTWLADMNGDGRADLFTHRPSDNAFLVSYGAVSSWQVLAHGYIDPSVTRVGDMTGDGRADVFTVASDGRWLRSNGGINSWEVINGSAIPAASTYLGDLNSDGREDVVAIHGDGSWRVSYSGTSAWQVINNGFLDPAFTQLVDMNGDGHADVFSKFADGSWRVSYSGTSAWQVVNNGELNSSQTWIADFDGDGRSDVFSLFADDRWLVSNNGTSAWQLINGGALPSSEPDGDGGLSVGDYPVGNGAPEGVSGVGKWTITTKDANGQTVPFDQEVLGTDPRPASGSWWDGQCGSNFSVDDKFAVLKQYNRPKPHSRMVSSKAKMYCGKAVSTQSESQFGLRHIRDAHESQFASLAAMEGRDWGNFMHWSISWTLSEPSWRTVQNKDRFCYEKVLGFTSPNGSTFDRYVVVILGRTGVRIMTSFPRTSDYCQGTRF